MVGPAHCDVHHAVSCTIAAGAHVRAHTSATHALHAHSGLVVRDYAFLFDLTSSQAYLAVISTFNGLVLTAITVFLFQPAMGPRSMIEGTVCCTHILIPAPKIKHPRT